MGRLFGTDGVRGVANLELTADLAFRLGNAHGTLLRTRRARPSVVVGKDTRVSGAMLEGAFLAGLCAVGVDVLQVGILPTPGVAWLVRELGADGGCVISASHNPIADNGLKLFADDGTKLADDEEAEVESLVHADGPVGSRPIGADVGQARPVADAVERYVGHLAASVGVRFDGRRIVLDCAHGAAWDVGPRLFRRLGAEVEVLHDEPDGARINVHCGCTHPSDLINRIKHGPPVDAGFAFDGDADRCLAVDEAGALVDGDQIMLALADFLHEQGRLPGDTVVATVMSNLGFEVALRRRGLSLHRAPVGDRFVLEAMRRSGAALGGEQSGHIIQLDYGPGGDGVFTAARLLQVMQARQAPLSRVTGDMQHYPQLLVNVRARDKQAFQQDQTIQRAIADIESQLKDRGRLLVRPSGTEPLVRVMAEGPDEAELQTLVHGLARLIEERLGE